jgi:serine/threonine protein phosphatase PrpC
MAEQFAVNVAAQFALRQQPGNNHRYDHALDTKFGFDSSQMHRRGDWLRNLLVQSFCKAAVGGSTTIAVVSQTGGICHYAVLGDCKIYIFRYDGALQEASVLFSSECQSTPIRAAGGNIVQMPMQAYCSEIKLLTVDYAKNVFKHCGFNMLPFVLEKNDTLVVCSDGVHDNLTDNQLATIVSDAYVAYSSPTTLAENIVNAAIEKASTPGGKPDDITAVVGYVYES